MDTGTAAPAAGSSGSLSSRTNRRRKWYRRFWRRSPPPAYPRHVAPRRKCFVRRLFRHFTKKRRHISNDTVISAFHSSRIREIDGPGLIPHEEEYEPAASAPVAGPSRERRHSSREHPQTSQTHASPPSDTLHHTSHPIRRDKSLPPTPRATRASANTHITFSVDSRPPSQRFGAHIATYTSLAEMNQRRTWRDSDQQASGGSRPSTYAPLASSSALQPTPGPSRTEAALPAPSTSARQRPSSAPSPRHLAPCAQPANAHSRHHSMPVAQRHGSAQHPRSAPSPLANPPDAPSSASPRPRSGSPQTSPQPSLRRSSGRILQERTFQTPAVVREGSSPEPPVIQPRSSRGSPPPNASGSSRAHNDANHRSNDGLHVNEVQPGPSTSTVNRSDPTAMLSTPPPGSTGQTTPDPQQNASAPRFVSAHSSMPIRELIAAELEALRERVEEHGRAHEPRFVRAREPSRRSRATTHATRYVPGSATLSTGQHRVGDEGEEAIEEGDEEGADDEWTDEDETPRVPATTFGAAQAQATRLVAEPARPQPSPPSPPQPALQVEEPILQRPQLPDLGAMEAVESPRSSIAMTFYPRSPLVDAPLTPPEFKLSEVPAGTQNVLRETEHRARALGGGESLQAIAAQVHAARQTLTKYRHITVVVDTDAKRRHTAAWMDGVRSMKDTCEEILRLLQDPANGSDSEWLSRRRQRLARYLTQLLKATKDIIADKRREYDTLIKEYNERENFVVASIREMRFDYDALREMRHWCGVEAARRYVRQDFCWPNHGWTTR